MLNRIPSSWDNADNDMPPIAPTSRPTIGNTPVVCSPNCADVAILRIHFGFSN